MSWHGCRQGLDVPRVRRYLRRAYAGRVGPTGQDRQFSQGQSRLGQGTSEATRAAGGDKGIGKLEAREGTGATTTSARAGKDLAGSGAGVSGSPAAVSNARVAHLVNGRSSLVAELVNSCFTSGVTQSTIRTRFDVFIDTIKCQF